MDFAVTGTLVRVYYCVCPRQAWLMARHLVPDEDDTNIEIGRFIHETAYQREKEIDLGNAKIDLFKMENGELVVGEVKKLPPYKKRTNAATLLIAVKRNGYPGTGEPLPN